MEEDISDTLMAASAVLRWFERYRISNALVLLSRLVRLRQIHTLDELEAYVVQEETAARG